VVREVTDQQILDAKARSAPAASAANRPAPPASPARSCSRGRGHRPGDRVVCILTGHQLKDPTATVAYHTTDQSSGRVQPRARQPRRPPRHLRQPRRRRVDHNDPEALDAGVEFKRAYNAKAAAFDQVATDLSVLVQQYTSVRLEEAEQTGGHDREHNERIIAELNREQPHSTSNRTSRRTPSAT
jgi:hypothetical protein